MSTRIKVLQFFTDILRDRIKYGDRIIPVYSEHTERIEPPFITFRVQKNMRKPKPYNYKLKTNGVVDGRLMGFFDIYTVNVIIFSTSAKMRDNLTAQVKEVIDKIQANHFSFCLNFDHVNETCKTTGRTCDARKLYSYDDFEAPCPYGYQTNPEKPDYRGPITPMEAYDITNYNVKGFLHVLDYSTKPPIYTTIYEVTVTIAEVYTSSAQPITGVKIREKEDG